jgi:hypothetical protein
MPSEDLTCSLKVISSLADEKSILLLDANDESRESRAKALRDRSLNVDCAATAEQARALWSPRSHELVLIEFRNASQSVHDFYHELCLQWKRQKFGFYVDRPPHLTRSYCQCEPTQTQAESPIEETPPSGHGEADHRKTQPGLSEAARQIAAVRRLIHPASMAGGRELHGISVLEALRIARRGLR